MLDNSHFLLCIPEWCKLIETDLKPQDSIAGNMPHETREKACGGNSLNYKLARMPLN